MQPEGALRGKEAGWTLLDEFSVPSEHGIERPAADRVAAVARGLGLPTSRVDQLHTAVAETVLNAMEHGNRYQRERPVTVRVLASPEALAVRVADQGDGGAVSERETPDLAAKLDGRQPVRGWGFYLIEHMVDEVRTLKTESSHTVELFLYLEGSEKQGDIDVTKSSEGEHPASKPGSMYHRHRG